ncbi:hypothetical protein DFH09DRAFT_1084682 [Mycena vulgaris]|nr:hypothetical protein DFH09DRAFT_1084682 [Mycena vulgaris]
MPFRQPLRDRCNILLRVCTDRLPSSTKSKLRANLTSSAGNTPLLVSPTRPRCRVASPPPLPTATILAFDDIPDPEDENGPREFIPFLHLFSPPSPGTIPAGTWTHAIRVLPASEEHPAGYTRVSDAASSGCGQLVDLYIAAVTSASSSALPLPRRHLLVARDFLSLALPYYACAHPEDFSASPSSDSSYAPLDTLGPPPPSQACRTDAVRVLLIGPPRAVLAMAVMYIAYASGCSVVHVMSCVVDEAEDAESCAVLGPDARMGLGDKELRIFERVVKKEM